MRKYVVFLFLLLIVFFIMNSCSAKKRIIEENKKIEVKKTETQKKDSIISILSDSSDNVMYVKIIEEYDYDTITQNPLKREVKKDIFLLSKKKVTNNVKYIKERYDISESNLLNNRSEKKATKEKMIYWIIPFFFLLFILVMLIIRKKHD